MRDSGFRVQGWTHNLSFVEGGCNLRLAVFSCSSLLSSPELGDVDNLLWMGFTT